MVVFSKLLKPPSHTCLCFPADYFYDFHYKNRHCVCSLIIPTLGSSVCLVWSIIAGTGDTSYYYSQSQSQARPFIWCLLSGKTIRSPLKVVSESKIHLRRCVCTCASCGNLCWHSRNLLTFWYFADTTVSHYPPGSHVPVYVSFFFSSFSGYLIFWGTYFGMALISVKLSGSHKTD